MPSIIRIPEAHAPFDICWDKHGIAHVFAENVADAYRGMGYAAASERLWQIHLSTLYATGKVAGVLGGRFVTQDLMHQVFKVPAYDVPDSPGDWIVDAYLEGMNACIRGLDEVPPEFRRAGISPREYTRHDVASRYRFTGWFQHKSWMEKIYLGKLMARHGAEWFERHVRRFSAEDAAAIHELRQALLALDPRVGRLLYPDARIASGSNNWVIQGRLSASGSPMMAMDPHQPHSIPNTFFYCHLNAPGWDAFGASFPGVPYFMMGFNQKVMWGLTTGYVDTYDVYVERPGDFESRSYQIEVKGEEPREFDISISRHGPVLESLTDRLGITEEKQRDYYTALRWSMRDVPTSAGTLARLPLAESAGEFGNTLFENDVSPLVNNIICVDRDNDLRRFIAATLPRRSGLTGTVPMAGWREAADFPLTTADDLLVERNPACGFALTANNDTMGEAGDFPIHNFPAHPARSKRIRELLEAREGRFSNADFEAMQLDLTDLRAKEILPGILSCLTEDSGDVAQARSILSGWDCIATPDSQAAALYYAFLDRRWHISFMREVLGDDLVLSIPAVAPGLHRFSVEDFLAPGSPWETHQQAMVKIICETMGQVYARLKGEFGDDFTFGGMHGIRFGHSLAKHDTWRHMRVGPDPVGGSPTTLRMAVHLPATGDSEAVTVFHGPAFRWVVDLADAMYFRGIIAGGNGGRPDSDFTSDQYADWLHGQYRDLSLVREELTLHSTVRISPG